MRSLNSGQETPQVIVALDNVSAEQAMLLVEQLKSVGISWFKVGLELYSKTGPEFIIELKKMGMRVFVDLKLYDIPNTVSKTVEFFVNIGADLLTVHTSGGREMLLAAQKSAEGSSLQLLGVTLLTSFAQKDLDEIAHCLTLNDFQVQRETSVNEFCKLAFGVGLSGVVCSVSDLSFIDKSKYPQKLFVTPGIRNEMDIVNDQKSVATVSQAIQQRATHLVIGRPITSPQNNKRPDQIASEILKKIQSEVLCRQGL